MRRSGRSELAKTWVSLSLDAPQVIAARTLRFCQPGALLSAGNQAEFLRMFTEKHAAAAESCASVMMNAAMMPQRMVFEFWSAVVRGNTSTALGSPTALMRMATHSLDAAIKPYQYRASANARKLRGKRKRR